MTKDIYDRLKNDEDYYGEFGQQFLSNSNISTLLKEPKLLHQPMKKTPPLLIGGYFHTAILEPHKLGDIKIIDATSRNTKKYKEEAGDEMQLLAHEAESTAKVCEALLNNDVCRDLVRPILGGVDYEEPQVTKLFGNLWKGKADIINHNEKLVVDLKTTGDITNFRWSASKYNYDSQAYIYRALFGYDMLFVAIDKRSKQIGLFDCSPEFYKSGEDKVRRASAAYDLFHKNDSFDSDQYIVTETL